MRRSWSKVLAFSLLLSVVVAAGAAAESRLVFPTLGEGARLSVLNVSDDPSDVVFRAMSETGELIAGPGVTNPVHLQIEPHGQVARSAIDLFGLPSSKELRGWVEVSSSGPNELKGSFQIGSAATSSTGSEAAAETQKSLVVLPPRNASLSGGVLHVVNTGEEFALVTIRLLSASGELVEEISHVIAPAGKLQSRLDDLSSSLVTGAATYLRIESTQEATAWMGIGSTDRPMGVPGVASETAFGLHAPFSLGPNMGAALRIASVSDEPTQLRLIFHGEDGQVLGTPQPLDFSLPSLGLFEGRLDSKILDAESGPVSGWIEIVNARTGDPVPAVGSLAIGNVRDGFLLPDTLIGLRATGSTSHVLILPDLVRNAAGRAWSGRPSLRDPGFSEAVGASSSAALSLHNLTASETAISIIQRSPAGAVTSSMRLTLGPGQYATQPLQRSEPRRGTVELKSSGEILGVYVRIDGEGAPRVLQFQPVLSGETSSGSQLAVDFRVGDGSRHTGEKAVNLNANFTLVSVTGALKTPPCAAGGTYVVTAVFRNSSGTHYYGNISAAVVTLTGGNTLTSQSFTLPAIGIVGPNEQITGVFNIRLATCNRFQFFINLMGDECAIPVNFRQMGAGTDTGGGTLHFDYRWNSSTGNLADLGACMVGERVDYRAADLPFPSPPFPAGLNPPNPTILNVAGTDGAAQDNHSTPGAFVKPYAAAAVTAMQIYRYTCPCANGGNPVTIFGPLNIVRSVIMNANGSFRFEITKSGATATINPLP